MGLQRFTDSNFWIDGLKNKNNLSYKSTCGEYAEVDIETGNYPIVIVFLIQGYCYKDIYKTYEAGLFCNILSGYTFAVND